jgi:hypothetical protein
MPLGRLALLYYPDHGYRGNELILTPRQVQVIEEYLGEA